MALKQIRPFLLAVLLWTPFLGINCATPFLKGMTPEGEKVYAGPVPIQDTEAYKMYAVTNGSEANKINYLFKRLQSAKDLVYYHDDGKYNWLEVYRAGKWLLRNRYRKGDDVRTFLRKDVWYSETTGKPLYIEFPDGSIHIAYYVLINEIDLLEETTKNKEVTPS